MYRSVCIIIVSFFLILPKYFYFNLNGYDIWWHLTASDELLTNFAFPTPDHYSYTAQGREWNQHSWLGALLYFFFYKGFGRDGLSYLTVSVKILTVFLTYFLAFRKTRSYSFSLLLSYCMTMAITVMVPRPYVFSPLMAVVYFDTLTKLHERISAKDMDVKIIEKISFILFFLSAAWINLHGEFVVGVIMIVSITLSGLIQYGVGSRVYLTRLLKYAALPSFAGFLINPHGLGGILYPLDARTNPSADFASLSFGGQGFNFGPPEIVLYSILLVCTAFFPVRLFQDVWMGKKTYFFQSILFFLNFIPFLLRPGNPIHQNDVGDRHSFVDCSHETQ